MIRPVIITPTLPSASPTTWRTSARMFIDPWALLPCLWLWPSSSWRRGVFSLKTSLGWCDSETGTWDAGSDKWRLPRRGDWAEAISFAVCTREARVAAGCPYRDEKDSEGEWWERGDVGINCFCVGVILPEATLPSVGTWTTLDALDEGVERLCEWPWEWPCSKKKSMCNEKIGVWMKSIPWKRNKPTMLDARPNEPTITTSFGFEISKGILIDTPLIHEN